MKRLESIFNTDGSFSFNTILSTPPTDVSSEIRGACLMKQAEVVREYAQMAARLADGLVVTVGILQVAIPTQLLASAYELMEED